MTLPKMDIKIDNHCSICFFGTSAGEVMGMPLCQMCFDHMWEIGPKDIFGRIKKRPSHDWWVAKCRHDVNATLLDCLCQLAQRDVGLQAKDSDTSHE